MNVTAVLAIRNEEAYLANCLRDLIINGLDFVVIDNDFTDSSAQMYGRSEFAAHLVRVCRLPFCAFSLSEQLQRKMEIIEALNSDWVVHVDADEIMHSYREGEGLREALSRLDAEGWNVVNFDEFVFLPIERLPTGDVGPPTDLVLLLLSAFLSAPDAGVEEGRRFFICRVWRPPSSRLQSSSRARAFRPEALYRAQPGTRVSQIRDAQLCGGRRCPWLARQ